MRFFMTMVVVGSAIGLGACAGESTGSEEPSTSGMDIETATSIAALEINADGSDIEVADATGDAPLLMRSCNVGTVRQHVVDHFDRDGDHQWGGHERPPMGGEFGRPAWGDQDGGASPDFGGDHPARAERLQRWKEHFDADASGDLDATEADAMHSEMAARCEERHAALVAEFDADGSGDLDEAEWQAAHDAIRTRFAEQKAKLVRQFDRDGDGALNAGERHEARSAIAGELHDRAEKAGWGSKGGARGDGGVRPQGTGRPQGNDDDADWGSSDDAAGWEQKGGARDGFGDGGAPFQGRP